MQVGIIGTGAISRKHAQAYKNIGFEVTVCTNTNAVNGRKFAEDTGAEFVATYEEVCRHPRVDYVDVGTFPDFRLQPLRLCAERKPMATELHTAQAIIEVARDAGIQLGV
jgi:UDP-N-acetyl-2-amino-2-deoxyglucuronate dehydrogenase